MCYKMVNIKDDPTAQMAMWSFIGCQQLFNLMSAFSVSVSNATMKITGTLWQGPALDMCITPHNKR